MRRPPTSSASDTAASEDAATDSGNAMRLQLSSRTVSVRAGGPGLEQLTIMIIISSTREGWASTRGRVALLVPIPMPRHDRSESRLARPVGCPPPPVSSEAYVAGVAVVSAVLGRLANTATSGQDG